MSNHDCKPTHIGEFLYTFPTLKSRRIPRQPVFILYGSCRDLIERSDGGEYSSVTRRHPLKDGGIVQTFGNK